MRFNPEISNTFENEVEKITGKAKSMSIEQFLLELFKTKNVYL